MRLLTGIGKKFSGRSDAELAAEIEQLDAERRAFHREHNGRIKDDAHAKIERLAAQARGRVDAWIAAHAGVLASLKLEGPGASLVELATLQASTDPELLEKLHAAIDGAPAGTFSAVTRAEYDRKNAAFDAGIRERRVELERRGIEWRKREAEEELAALEEKTEGTPARAAAS